MITQYWVMEHFSCIHCARLTFTFDLFIPKLGHVTRTPSWIYVLIFKYIGLCGMIYSIISADFVAPLLGNRCCHGYRLVPHSSGVVLMPASSMNLIGPSGTELRHTLAIYIICSCDLDLWPISPKIGSRDPEVVMNIYAYLEVYRRVHFWNIRS